MRKSTLALAATALAAFGWSGVGVASAAAPKCTDLGGVVDADQICRISVVDSGYTLNIAYPVAYPDATAVYDYVKETRDGFLNVAKTPDSRAMPYELETTETEFGSSMPPKGTQSVVFKTYQGVGGAHPTTFYRAFNWNQGLRKPIAFDTLFREGAAPLPIILPLVQAEVNKQLGQPVTIEPGVGLDPTKYQNFAITDDQLIFFFSQGDLLPESAGALQIAIPRGPVDAMIG